MQFDEVAEALLDHPRGGVALNSERVPCVLTTREANDAMRASHTARLLEVDTQFHDDFGVGMITLIQPRSRHTRSIQPRTSSEPASPIYIDSRMIKA